MEEEHKFSFSLFHADAEDSRRPPAPLCKKKEFDIFEECLSIPE